MKIIETRTREEWLEARRGYLTATDLAKIMTGGACCVGRGEAFEGGSEALT